MNKMHHIEVNVNDLIGERLDKFISLKSKNQSRSKIKQLILNKIFWLMETQVSLIIKLLYTIKS